MVARGRISKLVRTLNRAAIEALGWPRGNPEPDGEWNEYTEDTVLERPRWSKADHAVAAVRLQKGCLKEVNPGPKPELRNLP